MIGFGQIGKGALPLIERHFEFDRERAVIIDPIDMNRSLADERNIKFIQAALTEDNYKDLLTPLLTNGEGQGFCVNVSVNVSSLDIIKLCQSLNVLYIDTVTEPWDGFYFDQNRSLKDRTNYALREAMNAEKKAHPGGTTAVSCCGANPGMVSWFVKKALLNIAQDINLNFKLPKTREDWAKLMHRTGVKGIHIAERDTQVSQKTKPMNTFANTWSVDGFISESMQAAELGWGTHEKWVPENAHKHDKGCLSAIYMAQPGSQTWVRTWCPTPGPQYAFLITHNESISIADYFTRGAKEKPEFRPTCHYAYRPCDDAMLSLLDMHGNAGQPQEYSYIIDEKDITSGIDELGVLLYGHEKNAYWYGSQLSIEEARTLAPYQNATSLQVSSAILAGMVWALENPKSGIVEAEEMDYQRCLEVQRPYLGTVKGHYTDWNPIANRPGLFPEELDENDPWQFRNILCHYPSSAPKNVIAFERKKSRIG